ncbi:MAG TPA: DUF2510 domain-containing protein [Microlunatus sp.]|nr:DUF2510 domain-containing protein [Microlunatus sp.]
MSAPVGWYPDPAGAPGRFRFWDGRRWSQETTDRPDAAPPPPAAGVLSAGPHQVRTGLQKPAAVTPVPPKRPWGWWLAAAAALVALVVIAALVVRSVGGQLVDGPDVPGDDPSQQSCPRVTSTASPAVPSTGDRVRSGLLSYPRLPAPFQAPFADSRTPFGHDVQSQQALVERSPDGETTWVAWALIARLMAGDGFYGPEQGAGVVADCVVSLFYNDHEIDRTDTRREAITVDGHPAYLIESHLTFDIPGILTKGEVMIVVVVDVGQQGEAGLFYGTIPDTSPQFLPPIRNALADLQVG